MTAPAEQEWCCELPGSPCSPLSQLGMKMMSLVIGSRPDRDLGLENHCELSRRPDLTTLSFWAPFLSSWGLGPKAKSFPQLVPPCPNFDTRPSCFHRGLSSLPAACTSFDYFPSNESSPHNPAPFIHSITTHTPRCHFCPVLFLLSLLPLPFPQPFAKLLSIVEEVVSARERAWKIGDRNMRKFCTSELDMKHLSNLCMHGLISFAYAEHPYPSWRHHAFLRSQPQDPG